MSNVFWIQHFMKHGNEPCLWIYVFFHENPFPIEVFENVLNHWSVGETKTFGDTFSFHIAVGSIAFDNMLDKITFEQLESVSFLSFC